MSMKINRRVFILSSLGFVYYVKVDDGLVIKRMQVVVNSSGYSSSRGIKNKNSKSGGVDEE